MKHRSCLLVSGTSSVFGIAMLAASCGCQQMQVHSAYGRGWNMATGLGQSFDWVPTRQKPTGEWWARNPTADALIRSTVERGFTAKGYKQASAGQADFWIDYHVFTGRTEEWQDFGPVVDYQNGALYLQVIDPASRQALFGASAESKLELGFSPDEVKRRIEAAVPLMLKRLPDWKAPRK